MTMKKRLLALAVPFLLLTACQAEEAENNNEDEDVEETAESQIEDDSALVSQNQLGAGYYRPALDEDGHYLTSKNRGITLELNSGININLFEKDLIRLSQEHFPTDEYFIQEGQYLPADLVRSWIGRKSKDNPDGLNPPEEGKGEDRVPRYLNSILELDFLEAEDASLQAGGISIGLALNTVDYYPAYQFGPIMEQKINEKEILNEGKRMADEIVQRMREFDGLETLPIMVSLYKQAPKDDLAGGVHIAKGLSEGGSPTVEGWTNLNEERKIFPLDGEASAEGNAFANFQSEVEAFFPNISGITGRVHYVNDQAQTLTINIMTQFYGETEMISYTQYLKQSAATYLPADIAIEIVVESSDGVEAYLEKGPADEAFYSHVFD